MSCELSHLDGAFVLGALSPQERLEFERHLPDCPACRRAVGELAGLPGLLSSIDPDDIDADDPRDRPPDTLLPSLLRRARNEQRRRTVVTALAAAIVAVALAAGSFVLVDSARDGDRVTASSTPTASSAPLKMAPVAPSPVSAEVALTGVAWGTRLDLTCHYAATATDGYLGRDAAYAMVVHTKQGAVEHVATWRAVPGRTMHLSGATAADRADVVSVEVTDGEGDVLLRVDTGT